MQGVCGRMEPWPRWRQIHSNCIGMESGKSGLHAVPDEWQRCPDNGRFRAGRSGSRRQKVLGESQRCSALGMHLVPVAAEYGREEGCGGKARDARALRQAKFCFAVLKGGFAGKVEARPNRWRQL